MQSYLIQVKPVVGPNKKIERLIVTKIGPDGSVTTASASPSAKSPNPNIGNGGQPKVVALTPQQLQQAKFKAGANWTSLKAVPVTKNGNQSNVGAVQLNLIKANSPAVAKMVHASSLPNIIRNSSTSMALAQTGKVATKVKDLKGQENNGPMEKDITTNAGKCGEQEQRSNILKPLQQRIVPLQSYETKMESDKFKVRG